MKKTLIIALIFCLLFTVVLVSCPNETKIPVKAVNIQDSVKGSLIEIKKLYNAEANNDNVTPPNNFYIEVGTIDNVENIKVGATSFTPTDMLKLSIGNNSFITQSIYKSEDGKLKIAAPVLQMELSREYPDIRVDNKKAFRTDYVSILSEMKPDGVCWSNNTTLGNPQLSADKMSVTITIPSSGAQNIGQTMLGIDFKYNDGSAPQTPTFYLTKKTVNIENGVKTYTYGSTKTDSVNNASMLGLYPYGWKDDTYFSEAAKYSKEIDYRVIGFVEEGESIKAVASGRLSINLSKQVVPIEDISIENNVKNSLIEIKKLYNTVSSESQSDNVTPPPNFYIEVGEIDSVENIKVGETLFTPTDKLKLSIGNNSFITQSVYKIEGGKLKIAAPVLQMELSREYPDIRVDNKKAFRTDYVSILSEMKPDGVCWSNNTTLGNPQLSADKMSVTITIPSSGAQNIGQTMLGIDFKYNDGSAPQTPTFYLTKKTVEEIDGVKTYTYGATKADTINSTSMLALYPYGWSTDNDFNTGLSEVAKYSKTMDYRVIGFVEEGNDIKAVASGRLSINLSKAQ